MGGTSSNVGDSDFNRFVISLSHPESKFRLSCALHTLKSVSAMLMAYFPFLEHLVPALVIPQHCIRPLN